jgi:hypothetical protein
MRKWYLTKKWIVGGVRKDYEVREIRGHRPGASLRRNASTAFAIEIVN